MGCHRCGPHVSKNASCISRRSASHPLPSQKPIGQDFLSCNSQIVSHAKIVYSKLACLPRSNSTTVPDVDEDADPQVGSEGPHESSDGNSDSDDGWQLYNDSSKYLHVH